ACHGLPDRQTLLASRGRTRRGRFAECRGPARRHEGLARDDRLILPPVARSPHTCNCRAFTGLDAVQPDPKAPFCSPTFAAFAADLQQNASDLLLPYVLILFSSADCQGGSRNLAAEPPGGSVS